ncbi:MAG: polysaccharide biosynthesis C-terminal domain-containing protein, partial [Sphingobium sp.]
MLVSFLIGINFGSLGLAWAWLLGYPVFALTTAHLAGRFVGLTFGPLLRAVMPGIAAAGAMAAMVAAADHFILPAGVVPGLRLGILVAVGGASYIALLLILARDTVQELIGLVTGKGLGEIGDASA